MEEQRFIVCVRVDEADEVPEDASTTACVECGGDIYLSTEGRTFANSAGAMPVCSKCGEKLAAELPSELRTFGPGLDMAVPADAKLSGIAERIRNAADSKKSAGLPDWASWPGAQKDDRDPYEELKREAVQAGELMQRNGSPDSDWGSLAVMKTFDGQVMPEVSLSKIFEKGMPKQIAAHNLLPGLAFTAGASNVFLGMSTFALIGKPGEELDLGEGSISDHPDRVEMLVLMDITADGIQRMCRAVIERDGVSPPRLQAWEDMPTDKTPNQHDGLFLEALVPALKIIRDLRNKQGK